MADRVKSDDSVQYRRVVLKLSGESFAHTGERGISMDEVVAISQQVCKAAQSGVQIAIVIGGGNILRGAQFTAGNSSIQEATAHYMGMLATVINGLALQDAIESLGYETRLLTAIRMDGVAEPYIRRRAKRHLEKRRIVILATPTRAAISVSGIRRLSRALRSRSPSAWARRVEAGNGVRAGLLMSHSLYSNGINVNSMRHQGGTALARLATRPAEPVPTSQPWP